MTYQERNIQARSVEDILAWVVAGEVEPSETSELLDIANIGYEEARFHAEFDDESRVEFSRQDLHFAIGSTGVVGAHIKHSSGTVSLPFDNTGKPRFRVRPTRG